jgi:RNA polymerase sigma-70 factor (ECF subfamily)
MTESNLSPGPDAGLLQREMGEPLQHALTSISTTFRTAVLLADVEGLSYEEIARIMGSSVGTVRSRVHRGRKLLRKHLSQSRIGIYGELSFEL